MMKLILPIYIIGFFFCPARLFPQIPANLLGAIQANNVDQVKEWKPDAAQLNSRDSSGATPLLWAAYRGDIALVQYLVEQGADPLAEGAICLDDSCGSYYGSLLCIAAGEGKLDMVQYFVERLHLDVNALEWNVRTGKRGMPPAPAVPDSNGWKPYNWGEAASEEWTALTWAVNNNRTEVVRYLLSHGANPDIIPGEPIRIAIQNRNLDIISAILEKSNTTTLSTQDIKKLTSTDEDSLVLQLVEKRMIQIPFWPEVSCSTAGLLPKDSAYLITSIYFALFKQDSIAFKYNEQEIGELLKSRPPDTLRLLGRLKYLGDKYFQSENHTKGDLFLNRWLTLLESKYGRVSTTYATGLREYTDTLMRHHLYPSAEIRFRELRALWERLEGKGARSQAVCLNNIGWNLNKQTRFSEAQPYLQESVALWKSFEKQEDAELIITLWNLGETLIGLEKYVDAEKIWHERLVLTRSVYTENSEQYAVALNDLGWLNYLKKNYETAESYLKQSLHTKSNNAKTDPESFKITCENLINVYKEQQDAQKVLEVKLLLLDTLLHYKEFETKVIDLYGDVGRAYRELKYYDLAITSFQYEMDMEIRLHGTDKWNYWDIHREIAETFYEKGAYKTALEWFTKYEKSGFRAAKESMVLIHKALGNYAEADHWYARFLEELKNDNFDLLKQANKWTKFFIADWNQKSYHLGYSNAFLSPGTPSGKTAYNIALHAKNAILEESKQINHFVKLSGNAAFRDSLQRLSELQNTYANLFHFQSKDDAIASEQNLTDQISSIQAYLSKIYYENLPNNKRNVEAEWKDIQSALKPNEAAIEFVNFKLHRIQWTDSTIYAAIVIRPGWDAPRFVPLFEADTLASVLGDEEIRGQGYADYLYPGTARAIPVKRPMISLHELVWEKLDKLLVPGQTVYFSSSGYLNRLNLSAVVTPNKQIAAERYRLIQMTSTRQLLRMQPTDTLIKTAVLFGGLQYSMDSITAALSAAKLRQKKNDSTRSSLDGLGMLSSPLDTLPFTRREVMAIAPILKQNQINVRMFTDADGIEEALYSVCGTGDAPGIMHFSTHGFFFSNPSNSGHTGNNSLPFALSNVGMLRSGIVFSGCNRYWTSRKTYNGMQDGILTAYEAAQLNLIHTELVVLSACETGLGDLNAEDGVFGLQSAFLQAGAHYVMISMWRVDDSTTKEFMVKFYQKWLVEHKPIPDAYRETEIEIRRDHGIAYLWAPFVLIQ